MYQPVMAGSALRKGETLPTSWIGDDTDENISLKNKTFSELTGQYWIWKHVQDDIVGIVHYRRYFAGKPRGGKEDILNEQEIRAILEKADIILPKKRHYWIETVASQYSHAHHAVDLQTARKVISESQHEYLLDFDKVMSGRSLSLNNMFISKKTVFDAYCAWLFPLLFAIENELDISSYSPNDQRVFGFLAERLLNVWLCHQKLRRKEMPLLYLEDQHWIRKGFRFVFRKFGIKWNS